MAIQGSTGAGVRSAMLAAGLAVCLMLAQPAGAESNGDPAAAATVQRAGVDAGGARPTQAAASAASNSSASASEPQFQRPATQQRDATSTDASRRADPKVAAGAGTSNARERPPLLDAPTLIVVLLGVAGLIWVRRHVAEL